MYWSNSQQVATLEQLNSLKKIAGFVCSVIEESTDKEAQKKFKNNRAAYAWWEQNKKEAALAQKALEKEKSKAKLRAEALAILSDEELRVLGIRKSASKK